MGRKCSHCGKTGHNSRTCNSRKRHVSGGRFRLFGVQLDHHHLPSSNSSSFDKSSFSSYADMNTKKSFSVDCLSSSSNSSSSSSRMSNISATSHSSVHHGEISDDKLLSNGYLSDGLIPKSAQDRKKGVQWSEQEHRIFLIGLEKLGKGDWRGISRNFVTTRTPTQVASHAQKYFLRQNSPNKRKRRLSLFDVGTDQLSLQMVNNVSISKPNNYIEPSTVRIDPFGFSANASTTVPTSFLDHVNYSTRLDAGKFGHSDHSPMSNHQYRRAQAISNAESFNSQLPTSSSSTGTTKGVAPDNLELALAAPMAPLGQQSKPCGRGLLFGPISVT